jgi:hypothetical protein
MAKNEKTSKGIGSIASKGLHYPNSLTNKEINKISGSALTQRPDHRYVSSLTAVLASQSLSDILLEGLALTGWR